jgi:hypothetical protein
MKKRQWNADQKWDGEWYEVVGWSRDEKAGGKYEAVNFWKEGKVTSKAIVRRDAGYKTFHWTVFASVGQKILRSRGECRSGTAAVNAASRLQVKYVKQLS